MNRTTSADVVVIGAGPAGSAAAATLARSGRSVVMIDRATFPRDKCCGDGLTTLALREMELLGFEPSMVPTWKSVDAAWIRSPSGRVVQLPLPSDGIFAATAPRRELDAALVHVAADAGVEVHDGCALEEIRDSATAVEVVAEGIGTITARYVVAADGMWSPTR
ncbi:MAG TPA: FAD-dependent monooxygenase, partial [Ilumatobacteraceae bacterium]